MSINFKPPAAGNGGIPSSVAGNIGLDPNTPGMQKAAQYWDMLDELHKSDPDAYQKLIDEQVKSGQQRSRTRQFLPTPGFVVKTFSFSSEVGRRKLFINISGFEGVEPPTSGNGTVLGEEAHGYQARSIPLLVSPLREAKVQKGGAVANCVDVVFNPWVIRKCAQENGFKQQVIRLAMRWVQDETSLVVSIPDARVINSVYKGGKGPNLRDPVPFPITLSEEEMREMYPETRKPPPAAQSNPAKPQVMQSPSDLLRAFKVGGEEGADAPGEAPSAPVKPTSDAGSTPKSALDGLLNLNPRPQTDDSRPPAQPKPTQTQRHPGIREVSPPSNSEKKSSTIHPGIREVPDPNTAKAAQGTGKKAKKSAVRKGFFSRNKKKGKKHVPLYPNGSNEHKPENPYPWANVVDLGSSDQEKLKRQMEQYAKTGNVDDPTFRAQKKAEPRYAEWDPRYKEQQERLAREKAAETAAAKKSPMGESLSQEEEAELDKLMAAADSGFGKVGPSRNDVEGSEFYDTLKSAMHMMGHGSADTDKSMFEDPESIAQFEAMTKHIMEAQAGSSTPADAAASDASALGGKIKGWVGKQRPTSVTTPEYTLKTTKDKTGNQCEKVVISLPHVTSMQDIDLQLSDSELKLSAKQSDQTRQKLNVLFARNVNSDACKAKFKKGKLTITVQHK